MIVLVGETDSETEGLDDEVIETVTEEDIDSEGETEEVIVTEEDNEEDIDWEGENEEDIELEIELEAELEAETDTVGNDVGVGVNDKVIEAEGKEEIDAVGDNEILEDLLWLGLKLGVLEFEGLAASLPTVISTPHTSGAFIVISYLQIVGSLTLEYEKVLAQATYALSSLA